MVERKKNEAPLKTSSAKVILKMDGFLEGNLNGNKFDVRKKIDFRLWRRRNEMKNVKNVISVKITKTIFFFFSKEITNESIHYK